MEPSISWPTKSLRPGRGEDGGRKAGEQDDAEAVCGHERLLAGPSRISRCLRGFRWKCPTKSAGPLTGELKKRPSAIGAVGFDRQAKRQLAQLEAQEAERRQAQERRKEERAEEARRQAQLQAGV